MLQTKKNVRSFYQDKVKNLSKNDFETKQNKIVQHLCSLNFWSEPIQLAAYHAFKDEADITEFYNFFTKQTGQTIAFPVLKKTSWDFYCNDKKIDLQNINAFIIPSRAFDKRGCRLGRGKGYYDQWLSQNKNSLKIGVCLSDQISEEDLPSEDHDIFMDMIVTDRFVLIPEVNQGLAQNYFNKKSG